MDQPDSVLGLKILLQDQNKFIPVFCKTWIWPGMEFSGICHLPHPDKVFFQVILRCSAKFLHNQNSSGNPQTLEDTLVLQVLGLHELHFFPCSVLFSQPSLSVWRKTKLLNLTKEFVWWSLPLFSCVSCAWRWRELWGQGLPLSPPGQRAEAKPPG